jgi:hypothetical protein
VPIGHAWILPPAGQYEPAGHLAPQGAESGDFHSPAAHGGAVHCSMAAAPGGAEGANSGQGMQSDALLLRTRG